MLYPVARVGVGTEGLQVSEPHEKTTIFLSSYLVKLPIVTGNITDDRRLLLKDQ